MTSLKKYLVSRIGNPAPSLTLDEWAEQIAGPYIKKLKEHMVAYYKQYPWMDCHEAYATQKEMLKFLNEGEEKI